MGLIPVAGATWAGQFEPISLITKVIGINRICVHVYCHMCSEVCEFVDGMEGGGGGGTSEMGEGFEV